MLLFYFFYLYETYNSYDFHNFPNQYYNDNNTYINVSIHPTSLYSNAQVIRTMYINLLEAVVTQSAWKSSDEKFKKREMSTELNTLYERNGMFRANEVLAVLESL